MLIICISAVWFQCSFRVPLYNILSSVSMTTHWSFVFQLYDFSAPSECPCTISYHPSPWQHVDHLYFSCMISVPLQSAPVQYLIIRLDRSLPVVLRMALSGYLMYRPQVWWQNISKLLWVKINLLDFAFFFMDSFHSL
jgi:hypothetical protein